MEQSKKMMVMIAWALGVLYYLIIVAVIGFALISLWLILLKSLVAIYVAIPPPFP